MLYFIRNASITNASVAELVDAADSKSAGSNTLRVRFPSLAPSRTINTNHLLVSIFLFKNSWYNKQLTKEGYNMSKVKGLDNELYKSM